MDSRRTTYSILIAIILLTIPCYCLGFFAYFQAQNDIPTLPPPVITPTSLPTVGGIEATFTPTIRAFLTLPVGGPTVTLLATPGQFATETSFPTLTPSNTVPASPTNTATSTQEPTMTSTTTPSPTSTATATGTATQTSTPTGTPTPTATPTNTATATEPAIIVTDTPTATALPDVTEEANTNS